MQAISIEEYLTSIYEPDCDFVDGKLEERNAGEWLHARTMAEVGSHLVRQCDAVGFEAAMVLRLRVSPTRIRVVDLCVMPGDPSEEVPSTPPFLCIEILSPEDRMSRLEVRVNDFLAMGVPYVWVIDPSTRQAYVATAAEGLREVKSGVLRTENPVIEVPLAEVLR